MAAFRHDPYMPGDFRLHPGQLNGPFREDIWATVGQRVGRLRLSPVHAPVFGVRRVLGIRLGSMGLADALCLPLPPVPGFDGLARASGLVMPRRLHAVVLVALDTAA